MQNIFRLISTNFLKCLKVLTRLMIDKFQLIEVENKKDKRNKKIIEYKEDKGKAILL